MLREKDIVVEWNELAVLSSNRLMSDSFGGKQFTCCCVVVPQGQNYILQRFGKYVDSLEAGCHFVTPCIEEIAMVRGLREDQASVDARTRSLCRLRR